MHEGRVVLRKGLPWRRPQSTRQSRTPFAPSATFPCNPGVPDSFRPSPIPELVSLSRSDDLLDLVGEGAVPNSHEALVSDESNSRSGLSRMRSQDPRDRTAGNCQGGLSPEL